MLYYRCFVRLVVVSCYTELLGTDMLHRLLLPCSCMPGFCLKFCAVEFLISFNLKKLNCTICLNTLYLLSMCCTIFFLCLILFSFLLQYFCPCSNRSKSTIQQQKESDNINVSLMHLWRCLQGLKNKNNETSIPLRESKLTHLLLPSLIQSGLRNVAMIACVSGCTDDYDTTLSILGNFFKITSFHILKYFLIYFTLIFTLP